MGNIQIEFSAEDVQEIKRSMDMGLGFKLGLGVGNVGVTVTRGLPAALSTAAVWFDAREGVDGTAQTWTDRNNSVVATVPASSVFPTVETENAIVGGAALVWPSTNLNNTRLQFTPTACAYIMIVAAYVDGSQATFFNLDRPFNGSDFDQSGASSTNAWGGGTTYSNLNQSRKNGGTLTDVVLPLAGDIVEFEDTGTGGNLLNTIGNFAATGTNRGWRGPISQVLGWTTKPTESELIAVREYFADLYGITLA